MKALRLAVPMLLLAGETSAGTLRCSFTEPFFSIEFDSATGVVTRTSPDDADPATGDIKPKVIAEGAKIRRADKWEGVPKYLLEAKGELILEIALSGQGSDGMSDMVFPWDGRVGQNVGGCESGKAPAYDAYEAWRDLGAEE